MIIWMLLVSAIHCSVITIKVTADVNVIGSLVRSESIPSGSQIFDAELDLLTSITTVNFIGELCKISLTSLTWGNEEKLYESDGLCPIWDGLFMKEYYYTDLDEDAPLELRACVTNNLRGFTAKFDSGNVRVWGFYTKSRLTEWIILDGPIIGFHF